jgi:hypothetical protein
MKPSPGVGLGRPVQRSLQFSDLVLLGGASHEVALTGLSLHVTRGRSSGPSHHLWLCCPPGSTGTTAASDALPARRPLPGSPPVIARRLAGGTRSPPGRGGPPQFPPPPSARSAPSTPGSSLGLHSRLFTPSMAFALRDRARHSLVPTSRRVTLTTGQASRDATDRAVAPPNGACDAGLRPGPFPDRAASLLPGSLATTRTGLTPAGDGELVVGFGTHHLQLSGRTPRSGVRAAAVRAAWLSHNAPYRGG